MTPPPLPVTSTSSLLKVWREMEGEKREVRQKKRKRRWNRETGVKGYKKETLVGTGPEEGKGRGWGFRSRREEGETGEGRRKGGRVEKR